MKADSARDQRKTTRVDFPGRVEVDLSPSQASRREQPPHPRGHLEAASVNLSEGGACLRLQEALEIHSRVTLRLFTESLKSPLVCGGRVAWVVQRLDLRNIPPFLYDVGVEFVDPSLRLRQLASSLGLTLKSPGGQSKQDATLQPATIHARSYVPRLQQEPGNRWHLVVIVDGVPCFSRRYALEREAIKSWEEFKRRASSTGRRAARATGARR